MGDRALREVSGKVALVTGGAGGIGLGMAQAFHAAGMKVALADIDADALAAAARSFADPERVLAVRLDVTDPAAWETAADSIEAALGPVQMLCNNAGVTTPAHTIKDCSFEEQTIEDWRWALDINLSGVFFGMRTILGRLRRSGLDGHLMNTASMAGVLPFPTVPPSYHATKFGVVGLSEALRLDLKQKGPANVGVSVLLPGAVQSRIYVTSASGSPSLDDGAQTETFMREVAERNKLGADARLMGERVLAGVRRDEFYIFSHPEYRERVERHYRKLVAAFAEPADPSRVDFPAKAG